MATIAQLAAQQIHDRLAKTDLPASTYQPQQPGIIKSTINAVGNGLGIPQASQNFFSNLSSHLQSIGKNYGQNVANDYMNATKTSEQAISSAGQGQQSPISAGIQSAGAVAPAVFAPVTEAISPVVQGAFNKLNSVVDFISGKPQGFTTQNNAANAQQAQQMIVKATQSHPELSKNIEAVANILMATVGEKGADTTGNLSEIPGKIVTTAEQATIPEQSALNVSQGINSLPAEIPQSTPIATDQTLQSRIKDATPVYNKNMIGTHVMTPDITDAQGNVVKGKITPRIAEESQGEFGSRQPVTSASEHAAGSELNNIKNYPDKGTALQKSLAVEKAISSEAERMRSSLQLEDKANPLNGETEKSKIDNLIKSNLPKEIQDKIGYIGEDNPLAKTKYKEIPQTDLNKALQEMSGSNENLPKTAAGKYYQKVLEAVKNYNGTREGKLDLRQKLDIAYKNARGKLAFGSDSQNALDEIHSDIRDSVNKDLKETTTNTDTQASLDKQARLYKANKALYAKAQSEAPTKLGRQLEKVPIAGKLGNRVLMREATSGIIKLGGAAATGAATAIGIEAATKKK